MRKMPWWTGVICACLAACGGGGGGSGSGGSAAPPPPPPPPPPVLLGLEIVPTSADIRVGDTVILSVQGTYEDGSAMPVPVLARTPDDSLPGPLTLEARWRRFPLFEQLADSVGSTGGRLEPGAVQYRLADGRLVASQAWWSVGEEQRPALRWITVARGSRLGAGRSAAEAWANLAGSSVPTAPGAGDASRLQEVRGWFLRAEAALRDGAWDEFGRALEAMRTLLEAPAASPER